MIKKKKESLNALAHQEILDNLIHPILWEQLLGNGLFLFQHAGARAIKTRMSEFYVEYR